MFIAGRREQARTPARSRPRCRLSRRSTLPIPHKSGALPAAGQVVARVRRQPLFVLLWLLPVWIAIGGASLAIAIVPVRRLQRLFGRSLGAVAFVPLADAAQQHRALIIGRTIRIAALGAPFRADCYPTAIVAQLLCRLYRVPSALHLGVRLRSAPGEPPLAAHAWVVSGAIGVTGGRGNFTGYTPLGCWVLPTAS